VRVFGFYLFLILHETMCVFLVSTYVITHTHIYIYIYIYMYVYIYAEFYYSGVIRIQEFIY
jgi:hypothetical protein